MTGGIWVLTAPTFRALTEVLAAVAARVPAAVLLLLSNHNAVAVRVCCGGGGGEDGGGVYDRLVAHAGCTRQYEFTLPHDGGAAPPPTQVVLRVATPCLLDLLRFCTANRLPICVYDFN